jgi:FlaA1/EpsC-like NDP-sugar epimerase
VVYDKVRIPEFEEMHELPVSLNNASEEGKLIFTLGAGASIKTDEEKRYWNILANLMVEKYENERKYQSEVKVCKDILANPDKNDYKFLFSTLEQSNRNKFWNFLCSIIESRTCSVYKKSKQIDTTDKNFSTKLLGRDTIPIYSSTAKEFIKDKVILVTGAGGSIGSEIVRQLVLLEPKKIYCLDIDEYSLYVLSREINENALLANDNIILADIRDKISISRIFAQINPDIVYHSAAHKHLPLLERSPVAAINTNIFGTDNIASACVNHGVKCFVNISTDKAARPISVLGMTKRLAEFCTAGYKEEITKIASVRFGNVLGSSGSFLHTLIWQIENEKTVVVTHPSVSRFFMSIQEASALVIEASSLATEGETYVLDMGTSIKIVDLIDKYVKITGCQTPNIIYTGLRKGEKLHEELFDPSEICTQTTHPKITKVNVDQSGIMTYRDKMQLKSMIRIKTTQEELRDSLAKLIYTIENRAKIVKEKNRDTLTAMSNVPDFSS